MARPFPRWLKYADAAWALDAAVKAASGGAVTWATLSGKPATFPPEIGAAATQAKAGNYTPSSAEVANALKVKAQIAALAAVTAADATDPATVITLANANKVAINAIIAALKA